MKINWLNYKLLKIDGYGRLGISCIKNLIRLGVDVHPDTIDCLEHPTWLQQAQGLDFSRATACLMPPYHMRPIPGRVFSYTMWESTKLDWERWKVVNKLATAMIVPSTWLVEMMRDQGVTIPIEVAGCSVDTDECQLLTKKVDVGKPYTFMCWGDRSPRKGDDIVWSAFYKAFGASKDVRLIIKCRGGSYGNFDMSNSDRRVSVWNADVDNVTDIYAHADCFVFPTRGEGLGMPPREAAACGVPTITTNWSGTADDIDNWAWPLNNFKMTKSLLDGGGLWATPNVDEVAELMLWMFNNREEAIKKAREKALWLRENRSYQYTANNLINIINKWA